MITFLLTDSDMMNALMNTDRREDGFLVVNLPEAQIQEQATKRVNLIFNDSAHTVQYGALSIRLSPLQFSLLRYVYAHGRAGYETLQDEVWGKSAGDNAIQHVVSKLNTKLLNAGFSIELLTRHSRVSLERVA